MPPKNPKNSLHLPSLSIKGFRGIKDLSISRLGRVTLLAGRNGIGKTTVLDAVRVYAARGRYDILSELLEGREEVSLSTSEDDDKIEIPDFSALFYGRTGSEYRISIGPQSVTIGADQLKIEAAPIGNKQPPLFAEFTVDYLAGADQIFKSTYRGTEQVLPWLLTTQNLIVPAKSLIRVQRLVNKSELPHQTKHEFLGPGLLSGEEISRFWDTVALTADEDRAVETLKLILGDKVDRIAVIGDDTSGYRKMRHRGHGRRAVVKLQDATRPVPLKSLGDGAIRLFGVALALSNSSGGFLLIDEAENGIHHSVQRDLWRMILKTAAENNVQVLATTHSYDCVRGFAQAITECEESDGALVRIERKDDEMWAVEYSEDNLRIAAEQHIEVR